jgi:hypothetical protein
MREFVQILLKILSLSRKKSVLFKKVQTEFPNYEIDLIFVLVKSLEKLFSRFQISFLEPKRIFIT